MNHLKKAIRTGRVSHAYLLTGEEKSGKRMIARTFTQALLCEQRTADDEPCGRCASCIRVMNDAHPDVRTIAHEKPASIRVPEIMNQVVSDAYLMPYEAAHKVYIIPDAHLMTVEAQNKLLKTLEEPPAYARFLLLATHAEALLLTIRSRCIPLSVRALEDTVLTDFLMRTMDLSPYRAKNAARFARGNCGRAKALAKDESFELRTRYALQMMEQLGESAIYEIHDRLKEIGEQSEDERSAREELMGLIRLLIRDILVYKATQSREHLILEERWEYIRDVALHATYRDLITAERALTSARERLEANVNAQLTVDMMLLRARDTLKRT